MSKADRDEKPSSAKATARQGKTNEEEAVEVQAEQVQEEYQATDDKQEDSTQELKGQLQRALADYQNLQRRVAEERIVLGKFATQYLLLELLPIVDQLEQAVETAPEEEKKSVWFRAVAISVKQLKDIVKKEGIEDIAASNIDFDPNEHEAIDTAEGKEDNKVIAVIQKGYRLHDKVIVAAKVRVSKKAK